MLACRPLQKVLPRMSLETEVLTELLTPTSSTELKAHLSRFGARLQHVAGRVAVSFSGVTECLGAPVPFHLIPDAGSLASKGQWARMSAVKRLARVVEVVTEGLREDCQRVVETALQDVHAYALSCGVALNDKVLGALDAPAATVSARRQVLWDRVEAMAVDVREAGIAQRTREAVTLADYPATYVQAHGMSRKFVALLGEPNSGKTHEAIEALVSAGSGVYLAPLRLLALENFERLRARGVKVSMVTGEECRRIEGATHVASTIEMLNYQQPVEVAIIDEIQMLDDPERGAAWTAAVCGVPACTVYLVGSLAARGAVESLASRLGCELEVRELHRKSALTVEAHPVRTVEKLRKGDAVIAFSRRDVLYWRDTLTAAGFSVATIYGNLSPEVRRAQAALFREGAVDVLVGTDALGMGLNMPIARVVFTTAKKFNGTEDLLLPPWLTQQIGGRAGRYGITEQGFVAGYDETTHRRIRALMRSPLEPTRSRGFFVAPTLEHLKQIAAATGESRLAELLTQFSRNIDTHDDYFVPANLEEQQNRAQWLDTLPLSLEDRFLLSLVPVSTKVALLENAFTEWATQLSEGVVVRLKPVASGKGAKGLQTAEDACKLYSAYAWLGYRRPDMFPDAELAVAWVQQTSEQIDEALRRQNQRTRSAGAPKRERAAPSLKQRKQEHTCREELAGLRYDARGEGHAAQTAAPAKSKADARLAGRKRSLEMLSGGVLTSKQGTQR